MENSVEAGTIRIIYTRGNVEDVPFPTKQPMRSIRGLLGAKALDTVNLRNGCVMLVDDLAHTTSREVNDLATEFYHAVCRPGTLHKIRGPVVIVRDTDFAS